MSKIRHSDLLNYIKAYSMKKLSDNSHKGNPLEESFERLVQRLDEERQERIDAFLKWWSDPTDANEEELMAEIGDELNFIAFIVGKVRGYDELKRE